MSHEPDRERSWAILIGTSDYESGDLQPLPGVRNNLVALHQALTDPATGVFEEDHCLVVDNPQDTKIFMTKFRETVAKAQDVLFVYYAGHGLLAGRDGELHLAVRETEESLADITAVKFEILKFDLQYSLAKVRILILDCCFSGKAIGAMSSASAAVDQVAAAGTFVLTSTAANKVSTSVPGERHTAFTGALIDVLKAGLPHGHQQVELGDLYLPLHAAMAARGLPTPTQRLVDNSADVVLRKVPWQPRPATETDGTTSHTHGDVPLHQSSGDARDHPSHPPIPARHKRPWVSDHILHGIGGGLRSGVVWTMFGMSVILLGGVLGAAASRYYADSSTAISAIVFCVILFLVCSIAPARRLLKGRVERRRLREQTTVADGSPEPTNLSDRRKSFYTEVFARLDEAGAGIRTPAIPLTNWCDFASGPFGRYALVFSKHGYRAEVYLDTGKTASTAALFGRLYERREEFRTQSHLDLTWERLERARASRIAVYLDGFDLQQADTQSRSEAAKWSAQTVQTLHRTFDTTLRSLARELKTLDEQPT